MLNGKDLQKIRPLFIRTLHTHKLSIQSHFFCQLVVFMYTRDKKMFCGPSSSISNRLF